MGFNRFYLSIVAYCLLIFSAAFLLFFFLNVRHQPSTAGGIAVIAVLLLIRLIYFLNRSNRMLSSFLVHMQEKDPSLSYAVSYADKNFRGLNESLEKLIREFKENRINLEVQAQYLDAILSNISTGILCFDNSGQVQTMNKAACLCLGTSPLEYVQDLDKLQDGLGSLILAMQADDQTIETLSQTGNLSHLSISSSIIKLKKETIHVIALNDITRQMEEQEIQSWKKLIRVINHEIMNSMTPIITLAMAIRKKLTKNTPDAMEDAISSASIIEERSNSLVSFIERYKKLTGLPPLRPVIFSVGDLFGSIELLFTEELHEKKISLRCQSDCSFEMKADRQMLEQVFINLVKNAIEALRETMDPLIELSCYRDSDQHLCLSIRDNGTGVPPDKLEQVFVPFFTTRKDGSGIGLSLCHQIIRLHKGRIHMESSPGKGTELIIRF